MPHPYFIIGTHATADDCFQMSPSKPDNEAVRAHMCDVGLGGGSLCLNSVAPGVAFVGVQWEKAQFVLTEPDAFLRARGGRQPKPRWPRKAFPPGSV